MADAGLLLTAPERLIRLFGVLQQILAPPSRAPEVYASIN